MRKNTRASGWRVLASKYCAITGEAPAGGVGGGAGGLGVHGPRDANGRSESRQPPAPLEPAANKPKLWMDVQTSWSFRDLSFVIFPAGPSDAEEMARVHVTSWPETYRGLLAD